jgi:malate dehydrogenase (oxaloacetate-decarboxylating)
MATTPTAAFSITLDCRLDNVPGTLGRLCSAIGDAGGNIGALDGFDVRGSELRRCLVVHCRDEAHQHKVVAAVQALKRRHAVRLVGPHVPHARERQDPHRGVDRPRSTTATTCRWPTHPASPACAWRSTRPALSHRLHDPQEHGRHRQQRHGRARPRRHRPEAAMPVMEGKALLFKEFGGVDGFPVCINARTADEVVEFVERIAPTFGGINLEDIKAPECFEIEERLKASLDIPVFHDDQHGTAVVTLAALWNSLKITGKKMEDLSVVIAGMGAAGVAIGKILINAGVGEIVGCDRTGAVYDGP